MKKQLEHVGLLVLGGAATAAGTALWNNYLEEKIVGFARRIKRDKKKIINFKKEKKARGL